MKCQRRTCNIININVNVNAALQCLEVLWIMHCPDVMVSLPFHKTERSRLSRFQVADTIHSLNILLRRFRNLQTSEKLCVIYYVNTCCIHDITRVFQCLWISKSACERVSEERYVSKYSTIPECDRQIWWSPGWRTDHDLLYRLGNLNVKIPTTFLSFDATDWKPLLGIATLFVMLRCFVHRTVMLSVYIIKSITWNLWGACIESSQITMRMNLWITVRGGHRPQRAHQHCF